jgi:hypothetical protein
MSTFTTEVEPMTRTLFGLATLAAAFTTMVACTPAATAPIETDDDDVKASKDDDDDTKQTTSAPAPAPTPTTPAPAPPPPADAGAPLPDDDDNGAACAQLTTCCGSLTDQIERIACLGAVIVGDQTACLAALIVCEAGGTGLGGGGDDDNGKGK